MAAGVLAVDPQAEVVFAPMSDGGDGLCDVIKHVEPGFGWQRFEALDALGRTCSVDFLWNDASKVAVIESARANGLAMIEPEARDVLLASSYGVGQLLSHVVDRGAREIVVGAGGSASVDGGLGCLQALGAHVRTDACSAVLVPGGFERIADVDVSEAKRKVAGSKLVVLSDVHVSLRDGWRMFAPQKGASPSDMAIVERGFAKLVQALGPDGPWFWTMERGGAAGGLSAALALIGAELEEGAVWVADRSALLNAMEGADMVLTGEGQVDETSLVGKAPGCVLGHAQRMGLRSGVVAGHLVEDARSSWQAMGATALGLTQLTDLEQALNKPAKWVAEATRQVCLTLLRATEHA